MNNFSNGDKEKLVFNVSFMLAIFSILATAAYIGLQTYVRWNINKDFTFLGGNELEALTISTFALVIALLITHRPTKN